MAPTVRTCKRLAHRRHPCSVTRYKPQGVQWYKLHRARRAVETGAGVQGYSVTVLQGYSVTVLHGYTVHAVQCYKLQGYTRGRALNNQSVQNIVYNYRPPDMACYAVTYQRNTLYLKGFQT